MNRKTTLVGIAGLLVSVAAVASADDIAVNGGFELGTGGDSDNWVEAGGGAAGTMSFRSDSDPISGAWSHQLTAIGDDTQGASAVVLFNSIADGGLASLQENTTLSFAFDAETDFGPGGVGFFVLRVLNGAGAIVADTGLQNIADGSNASAVLNVPAFGGGDNDSYAAFVEISTAAGAFDGSFSNAKIDNVTIDGTLVPSPASAALLGLGGLLGMRRRR